MDPGRKDGRAGLLIMKIKRFCLTLTFFLLILNAAAAQNKPVVIVETSPKTPIVGQRWVLSLLVDHGVPGEVNVSWPPFAFSRGEINGDSTGGAITADGYTIAPRFSGTRVQTAIEYRFIASAAGVVVIQPLKVTTPAGSVETEPVTLQILASAAEQKTTVLKTYWEGAPAQMAAGANAVFALRASGEITPAFTNAASLPPQEFFMTEAPQGAILESLPLSAAERENGLALRLNLVPLTGDFRLSARTLQHEKTIFEIPPLHIRISGRAAPASSANSTSGALQSSGQDTALSTSVENTPQFPAFDFSVFDKSLFHKDRKSRLEEICGAARDLWTNGQIVQSLAELRHNERDHPQGAYLSQIRRSAEESLGFFDTKDESRWQRNLILGLSFFIFFLVIVIPFVCLLLVKNSPRRRSALICAVVIAVLSSLYLYNFVDHRGIFSGHNSRFGITGLAAVRRTADTDGEQLFSFKEGQPVEILLKSELWLFVRTNDAAGITGWIPAEDVTYY